MKGIFYHPSSLDRGAVGSGIRPAMMCKQLSEKLPNLTVIAGDKGQRKEDIASLKQRIENGEKFDFAYIENLTLPLGIEIRRMGPLPFYRKSDTDMEFLNFCISNNIPIHYFYRDIYWDFPEAWSKQMPALKKAYILGMQRKYGRRELEFLKSSGIHVYVPSQPFAQYLKNRYQLDSTPLSPGSEIVPSTKKDSSGLVNLIYVGGVSSLYISDYFLHELKQLPEGVSVHLCCRKAEYDKEKERLSGIKNMVVHHKSGEELRALYDICDIALYPLKPEGYGALSYSIKIPEYICRAKPIICLQDTICGNIVSEQGMGWVLKGKSGEMVSLLEGLVSKRQEIELIEQRMMERRASFTWSGVADKLLQHVQSKL